ncbi:MAG: AAA family ATPase [Agitococcus sp.]|jgi:chromosome partitioning protein|nr:AAA family ATPase [Agitococcus sp.]
MGKVVVFGNQKGGCGKTTLAITLACGLKEQGFSVLTVDADPQGSVMSWAVRVDEGGENSLPDTEKHDNVLIDQALKRARDRYDVTIVDLGSNLGFGGDTIQKMLLKSLREADYVFIPVGPSPIDVDASEAFVDVLRDIWERRGENVPAASFVINGVRKGTTLGREIADVIKDVYEMPVFDTKIDSREAYRTAFMNGSSVFKSKQNDVIENATAFVNEAKRVIGL